MHLPERAFPRTFRVVLWHRRGQQRNVGSVSLHRRTLRTRPCGGCSRIQYALASDAFHQPARIRMSTARRMRLPSSPSGLMEVRFSLQM